MDKEIVVIYWKDCSKQGNDTETEESCMGFHLADLISVGIFIKENDEFITLGNDWYAEYKNYRDVVTYPKSGISKIKRIKIKAK